MIERPSSAASTLPRRTDYDGRDEMIKIAEALMRASTLIDMPNVGMPRWSVALAILHDAEGGASSMWNISKAAVFWRQRRSR